MADRGAPLTVPIIVAEVLSPAASARWYMVWMMASAAYIVPVGFGLVLFTELADGARSLRARLKSSLRASVGVGLAAAVALSTAGPPLLGMVGQAYRTAGTDALRVLAVGVLPLAWVYAYHAVCRATARTTEAAVSAAIGGVLGASAAGVGAWRGGLLGTALGWVVVQVLTGVWALIRLRRLRAAFPPTTSDST